VQSAIIPKIFNPEKQGDSYIVPYTEFLIFTGVCVISAISARRFLDTLSEKLIQDIRRLEGKQKRTEDTALAAIEATELFDEQLGDRQRNSPSEPVGSMPADETSGSDKNLETPSLESRRQDLNERAELSPEEHRVLNALMHMTFRTPTGISKETGIKREYVGDLLDSLATKTLVERTVSPATGGPRWKITPQGLQYLALPR
jgi:hypothetical protein